jgi:CheY-like chemotaxis protein
MMPCLYHVEDNDADRRLLALALHSQGIPIELHAAHDGEHALEILRTAADGEPCLPDLIILDLNLPKRSGHEVLAAIRQDKVLHRCRVVVLTSSDSPTDREQVEELGIVAYIRKPMGLDGFLNLGAELLKLACGSST